MARGRIYKRGETWRYVFDLPPDPATGKCRQKAKGGFPVKKAAEDELAQVLARNARGEYVLPAKLTLGAYLQEDWLPAKRTQVEATTAKHYEWLAETYIIPTLGFTLLGDLKSPDVQKLYNALLEHGGVAGKRLSTTTVRHVHRLLRAAFADAVKWRMIPSSPLDGVQSPRAREVAHERAFWDADQLGTFLDAVREDHHFGLWYTFDWTGMRRGEALGLEWSAVDLRSGTIRVRQSYSSAATMKGPKTSAGFRLITIDEDDVAVLEEWRIRQVREIGESDFVFAAPDLGLLNPWTISTRFRRIQGYLDLGLPKLRLHDLRHAPATILLDSGVEPKIVQERLGHSDVSITLGTYRHTNEDMHRQALAAVKRRGHGGRLRAVGD